MKKYIWQVQLYYEGKAICAPRDVGETIIANNFEIIYDSFLVGKHIGDTFVDKDGNISITCPENKYGDCLSVGLIKNDPTNISLYQSYSMLLDNAVYPYVGSSFHTIHILKNLCEAVI